MQRRCIGCGEILQNEFPDKPGYTPVIKDDVTYCKRCFRMMHYNELPKVLAKNEDYLKVVNHVLNQNGLMILMVDIFSFGLTFSKEIIDKLRGNDVILVVNKFDLLPKSVNVNDVLNFVSKECEKLFFRVIAIHIVSASKGYYIDDIVNTIDLCRKERNVYVLGAANVGKSSFINAILKRCTSRTNDVIATSIIPGTTLDEIIIPFFSDNKAFIDTPGLINPHSALEYLDPKSYSMLIPNKEVKPITYQVFGDYTYFIGGLAYIKFNNAKDVSLVVYVNDKLKVTRCKNEKINEVIENRIGNSILPPSHEEIEKVSFTVESFTVTNRNDIFFAGFGFASVIGKANIEVGYLKNTEVKLYETILKKANRNR